MVLRGLKSKLHRVRVTGADLNYVGSLSLCPILMEAAGILENEQVHVLNVTNGARLVTYAIQGVEGEVCANGAAARLIATGDTVLVLTYADFTADELSHHTPPVVHVDEHNVISRVD